MESSFFRSGSVGRSIASVIGLIVLVFCVGTPASALTGAAVESIGSGGFCEEVIIELKDLEGFQADSSQVPFDYDQFGLYLIDGNGTIVAQRGASATRFWGGGGAGSITPFTVPRGSTGPVSVAGYENGAMGAQTIFDLRDNSGDGELFVAEIPGNAFAGCHNGSPISGYVQIPWYDQTSTVGARLVSLSVMGDPSPESEHVTWRATFSAAIDTVGPSDFTLISVSGDADGTVTSAQTVSQSEFDIVVGALSGNGTVRLDLKNDNQVVATGSTDPVPGFAGQVHQVARVAAPVLMDIKRLGSELTNADTLGWSLTFDQAVTVAASDLRLEGTTASLSLHNSNNGAAWTVTASGGNLSNLNGTVSLAIAPGQNIQNDSGDTLQSTVPTGANSNSYSVDNTPPSLTSFDLQFPVNAVDSETAFLAVFSEDVANVSIDDFELVATGTVSGTIAGISSSSGGARWTVTVDQVTGEGTLSVRLKDGTDIRDIPGNAGVVGSISQSRQVDRPPLFLETITRLDPSPTNQEQIRFLVTFSAAVSNSSVSSSAFGLNSLVGASISSLDFGTNGVTVYVALPGGATGDVELFVKADNQIQSEIGTPLANTVPRQENQNTYELDGEPPLIEQVALVGAPPGNASSVQFRVSFNEAVSGALVSDFVAVGSGTATGVVAAVDAAVSGSAVIVKVDQISGEGILNLAVKPESGIVDSFGNGGGTNGFVNPIAPAGNHKVDQSRPMVLIATDAPDPSPGSFTVSIQFNEPVTGLAAGDFVVVGGTVASLSGSGSVYSALISASVEGEVGVSLPADVTRDGGGNGNSASNTLTLQVDGTAPGVEISTSASDSVGGAFPIVITFDEAVTGFEVDDLVAENASISDFTGSGKVYGATLTPASSGPVSAKVPAASAMDTAGNGNTASNSINLRADLKQPTVALSTNSPQIVSGAFEIAITFSEDIEGLEAGDFLVSNASLSDLTGNGSTFTVLVTPTADERVTVSLPAAAAMDRAGNPNQGSNEIAREADGTLPVLETLTVSDEDLRLADAGTMLTLTLGFSEALDKAVVGRLTFDTDISPTVAFGDPVFSEDGRQVTFTGAVTDGNQAVGSVGVTVSGFADPAGNAIAPAELDDVLAIAMNRGVVTIETRVAGAVDGSFPYSGDLGDFTEVTEGQKASRSFSGLAEGSYSLLLAKPAGFSLDAILCDGVEATMDVASGKLMLDIVPGDVATCSFDLVADPALDPASVPEEVSFDLPTSFEDPSSISTTFELANLGGAPLPFSASVDKPWLLIMPETGEVPANGDLAFTLSFNDQVMDLPPGPQTAVVTVTNLFAPQVSGAIAPADVSIIEIPVTIQIAPRNGTLTLLTTTSPAAAGDGSFAYSSTLEAFDGLTLTTVSGRAVAGPEAIDEGSYVISQGTQEAWALHEITCSGDEDGGSVVSLEEGSVTVDLDAEETIVCTFANRRDEAFVREVTTSAIRDFMSQRADRIVSDRPRLANRLTQARGGTATTSFQSDLTGSGLDASFATSLSAWRRHIDDWKGDAFDRSDRRAVRPNFVPEVPNQLGYAGESGTPVVGFPETDPLLNAGIPGEPGGGDLEDRVGTFDVWAAGSYSSVRDDRYGLNSKDRFAIFYLGADILLTKDLVVGALAQVDRMETVTGTQRSEVSGTGWMAGPYAVYELYDGLVVDARIAAGRSSNSVNPLGLYTDDFESNRYLVETNLTGLYTSGAWRLVPEAGIVWFDERSNNYVDSLGFSIPGQSVTLGRLRAGPSLAYRHELANGSFLEPFARFTFNYDYNRTNVFDSSGALVPTTRFRADGELGLTGRFANGVTLTGQMGLAGIGEGDFEATSFGLNLRVPIGP